ncbi:hypothetical protein ACHAXT_005180 [Thalassiosira profunda]
MAASISSANDKKRRYRMAALDLDGTLLNSNHEVSDATVDYLRHLHARGFVVAIATGRSAACAAHIVERLDLSPDVSESEVASDASEEKAGFPLVCTNGARGVRIRKQHSSLDNPNPFLRQTLVIDEELFHDPLSEELTKKTLAVANKLGLATNYYYNHHIYAVVRNEEQRELTRRYGKLTGSSELYCYLNDGDDDGANEYSEDNLWGYQGAAQLGPPSKLLILCETSKVDAVTELVQQELNSTDDTQPPKANVIRGSPPFFVEILDPAVHKGRGLRRLCESLSMPLEEVIAFGDGDNDLEFIEMAGCGVAMKNARDSVKGAAKEVTEWTNDEEGVIKTLQRFEREGRLHFQDS